MIANLFASDGYYNGRMIIPTKSFEDSHAIMNTLKLGKIYDRGSHYVWVAYGLEARQALSLLGKYL